MRIIAGTKRGMKLFSPKTYDSRPITDRVKESLFSLLHKYNVPTGKCVADLFCGVGSLGLEALSRGAELVAFVEKDPKTVTTLRKNMEKAGFGKQARIITADAFKTGAPVQGQKYDLVFVDPPYATTTDVGKGSPITALLDILAGQLNPAGLAVVRTDRKTKLMEGYGPLQTIECRNWGTMAVTILQMQGR
jgi:16S rRNA (guanine966-N2)-methyltransferase